MNSRAVTRLFAASAVLAVLACKPIKGGAAVTNDPNTAAQVASDAPEGAQLTDVRQSGLVQGSFFVRTRLGAVVWDYTIAYDRSTSFASWTAVVRDPDSEAVRDLGATNDKTQPMIFSTDVRDCRGDCFALATPKGASTNVHAVVRGTKIDSIEYGGGGVSLGSPMVTQGASR